MFNMQRKMLIIEDYPLTNYPILSACTPFRSWCSGHAHFPPWEGTVMMAESTWRGRFINQLDLDDKEQSLT